MKTESVPSSIALHGSYRSRNEQAENEKMFMNPAEQNIYMARVFKEEPIDYGYKYQSSNDELCFKKNSYDSSNGYDRNRIQHNSSHVSDNVSVIPWRQTTQSEQDGACDSSTSPSTDKHHVFAVPHEPKKLQYDKSVCQLRLNQNMTPAEFLAMNKSRDGRPLSTATSLRSTVLDFPSRNCSGFSNAKQSARGRKRMLSASPLSSDFIDPMMFNEILRTSPSSLVAYVNSNEVRSGFTSRGSGRNSSAASMASHGSYGHLSASSASPFSTPISHRQRSFFQTPSRETPHGLFNKKKTILTPQIPLNYINTNAMSTESVQSDLVLKTEQLQQTKHPHHVYHSNEDKQIFSNPKNNASHHQQQQQQQQLQDQSVSQNDGNQNKIIKGEGTHPRVDTTDEEGAGVEGESVDRQCLWKGCGIIVDNQAALVQHVNTEHIQKNKKDCSCYWEDCTREEKPFKAMYMLVVHVRRHTGEKPHKCHYEGCAKAYSRLENLKTHVRSHTGERPYVCEIPGCKKAFSNASDRAKHQNRTHSSVKQYGCKVNGCTKRYTDPSSLRKHMKTVHNALPQPTKKFKASPPDKFQSEERYIVPKKEEQSPESDDQKNGNCSSAVRNVNYHYEGQGSPSYPMTNGFGNHTVNLTGLPSFTSQNNHSNGTTVTYGNVQRMWGNEHKKHIDGLPADEPILDINSNNNFNGITSNSISQISPNLLVDVQPSFNTGHKLYKPIEAHPPEIGRIGHSANVMKRLSIRRGSNSSDGSNDSGMDSLFNGSRRGSNFSDQSGLSAGRLSANLASPLPSRTLSPRCIEPTVIEGEVLEHVDRNQYEYQIKDALNNNNGNSRMSSGYGSQNLYFPTNNRVRASPAPPSSAGPRRASDGNVKRVSDSGLGRIDHIKAKMISRRGSEPIRTTQIMEETPRRHSLSNYKPLPVPNNMQQSLLGNSNNNNTNNNQNINNISQHNNVMQNFQAVPVSSFNSAGNEIGKASNILQMLAQTNASQQQQHHLHQQQLHQQQQKLQQQQQLLQQKQKQQQLQQLQQHTTFQSNNLMTPNNLMVVQQNNQTTDSKYYPQVLKAAADSTMTDLSYPKENVDPLESFVDNYEMQPEHHFYPQQSQYMQPANQPNQIQDFQNNNKPSSFMHPTQSSAISSHNQTNNGGDPNYNLTLQWRDNHFIQKQIEPDSTIDPDNELEKLMIEGLVSLATSDIEPHQMNSTVSNMTINTMDTLMTSFAEENKYFENQAYSRYP